MQEHQFSDFIVTVIVITMMFSVRKEFFVFAVFASVCGVSKSTSAIHNDNITTTGIAKNQDSLTNSYNELLQDVRWFFQRLEDFSSTAERILPNASFTVQTRSLSESTRFNFLIGLRHLLTGIKELSITFRKSLEADHMRQFQYVIHATNTLHEAFKTLKTWFSSLRTLMGQIFRVYNRHIPEVLLGKCLGRYIVSAYPERTFYEYPFLLLSDIYNTVFKQTNETQKIQIESLTDTDERTELPITTESISIEQNEIPHSDQNDYNMAQRGRALRDSETNNEDYLMSFLNFNDVLEQDKENIIESAVEKHSWQKCFKMYTAETIVRKLKIYFLEME